MSLFKEGETADAAYVVQEGSFELTMPGSVQPSAVGVGVLIGELALITETTRSTTVTAREPSTVIRIPRSVFLKMLEADPAAARRLRNSIAARVNDTSRELTRVRKGLDGSAPTRR